ncbi:MAG: FRG domain-containing protein [Pseudomonadales bacterium]|nr:FRG domain-containing protein [Pseudomonadales bacterium]
MSYECKEHQLNKAEEFFDLFLGDNIFGPKSVFDVSERDLSRYIFRGQSDSSFSLIPSAHRKGVDFNGFTPQPLRSSSEKPEEKLALHLHAEFRSITLFLEAADSAGLPTPLDYNALKEHDPIFDRYNLRDYSPLEKDFPDRKYLPSMAMAQHYGVPTRLLDWTESPFIAAYFAALSVSKIGSKSKEVEDGARISVTCLSRHLIDEVDGLEYVSAPRAGNPFLCAQKGAFTLIKNANPYFLSNGEWPSVEASIKESDVPQTLAKYPLIKVTLPCSEADELLRLLYRLGISRLTLMPSYESAASSLAYKEALWSKGG